MSTSGRQDDHISSTHNCIDRRQLLLAVSTLPALAEAAQVSPAQATAVRSSCQLQDSSTGLQWCDITVGEGQLPIKSAFTK